MQVEAIEYLIAAHVNDLALLVHNLVVFEHVLANFAVALFNGALRTFNSFCDHFCFNCFVVGQCARHHPAESTCCKQAQEFILERQIETAFTWVALTPCTTTQLVVDTTAFMALCS